MYFFPRVSPPPPPPRYTILSMGPWVSALWQPKLDHVYLGVVATIQARTGLFIKTFGASYLTCSMPLMEPKTGQKRDRNLGSQGAPETAWKHLVDAPMELFPNVFTCFECHTGPNTPENGVPWGKMLTKNAQNCLLAMAR